MGTTDNVQYFNSKTFNANAFAKYSENHVLPDLKKNELINCGVLTGNKVILETFEKDTGTYYQTLPYYANIGGEELNYDGQTDIYPTTTPTASRGVITFGRAKAWTEKDFSYDITAGVDFMAYVDEKIKKYKDDRFQERLLAVLEGIFSMDNNDKDKEFAKKHTYTITTTQTDRTALITGLNSAIQQACGDNLLSFKAVIMPSIVATTLENLNCLKYYQKTDPNGMQRDLKMATWNGVKVLIDDSLPVNYKGQQNGYFTLKITGDDFESGNKITLYFPNLDLVPDRKGTIVLTCGDTLDTNKGIFTKDNFLEDIVSILNTKEIVTRYFKVTKEDTTTIKLERVAYGKGFPPELVGNTSEKTIAISELTDQQAATDVESYVLYALGEGAIDSVDLPVKNKFEMDRNPSRNGGEDILYVRYRGCLAPKGISYVLDSNTSSLSPTNNDLKNGKHWTLVRSVALENGDVQWFDHRAIPICKIVVIL